MKSKIFLILLFATQFACAQKQKHVSVIESCEYKKTLNLPSKCDFLTGKSILTVSGMKKISAYWQTAFFCK